MRLRLQTTAFTLHRDGADYVITRLADGKVETLWLATEIDTMNQNLGLIAASNHEAWDHVFASYFAA